MTTQNLPALDGLEDYTEKLCAFSGRRALVLGSEGTGRLTVAQKLAQRLPDCLKIDLPQDGLDRPLHLLVQLAARHLEKLPEILAGDYFTKLHELCEQESPLILVAADRLIGSSASLCHEHVDTVSMQAINHLWLGYRGQVYLFAEENQHASWQADLSIRLPSIGCNQGALSHAGLWGDLAEYALMLEDHDISDKSPISVRLAIGLLALGAPRQKVSRLRHGTG